MSAAAQQTREQTRTAYVSGPGEAAHQDQLRGTQSVLVLAMALYRGYGLSQAVIAVALDAGRYPSLPPVLTLVCVIAAENMVVIWLCVRRRIVRPGVVLADTAVAIAGLVAGARLTSTAGGHTWAYFMYPVSLVGSVAIGFAYRRLSAVIILTTAIAAAYIEAAVTVHHDPVWNAVPNTLSYYANTTVAWAVARYLRTVASRLDLARAGAVEHSARTAREEVRSGHARALHDRVLQTLESLARGRWITDPGLRSHLAADAAWLRAFVEGNDNTANQATDLLAGLQALVQRMALVGLHAELGSAQLREMTSDVVAAPLVAVLVEAAGEALTNVAKHAGVDHATVRAQLHPDSVEVSIADRGCGFNPSGASRGLGLRSSITARLAEAGGIATIETAPGAGTVIRLIVPRRRMPVTIPLEG